MKSFAVVLLLICPLFGQQARVPEIQYRSIPDLLKLPADIYLGEAAGVAVNSKGHIFVFSRGNSTGPAYGASAAQLLEFKPDGTFVREVGHNLYAWSYAHAVKIDNQDNIWVADKGSDMVIKFTPAGRVAMVFGRKQEASAEEAGAPVEAARSRILAGRAFAIAGERDVAINHLEAAYDKLLECQAWRRKSGGFVVTNPNCSAIGLVLALAPLEQRFGLKTVMAVTMQAVSGAGYPGVASLDILGNVIPYIAKEEEKMEEETRKLLGRLNGSKVEPAAFAMSAQCNRVAVEDGHTESVSVELKEKAQREEIIATWNQFRSEPQELRLPSAPEQPVVYLDAADRPQPRFDADSGAGMTTTVGRLRPCGVLDWKFTLLSHNTIRGAAGAALLNAELLKAQGYLD